MNGQIQIFKSGPFRLVAEIRGFGSDPIGWSWPWPFEVRIGQRVIAVCRDNDAANGAVRDWVRSEGGA